jgi:hypothetical protein
MCEGIAGAALRLTAGRRVSAVMVRAGMAAPGEREAAWTP